MEFLAQADEISREDGRTNCWCIHPSRRDRRYPRRDSCPPPTIVAANIWKLEYPIWPFGLERLTDGIELCLGLRSRAPAELSRIH